jgi:hypothetical protein
MHLGEKARQKMMHDVAAAILAALEDRILPPGMKRCTSWGGRIISASLLLRVRDPPGWKPGSTAGRMPAATIV